MLRGGVHGTAGARQTQRTLSKESRRDGNATNTADSKGGDRDRDREREMGRKTGNRRERNEKRSRDGVRADDRESDKARVTQVQVTRTESKAPTGGSRVAGDCPRCRRLPVSSNNYIQGRPVGGKVLRTRGNRKRPAALDGVAVHGRVAATHLLFTTATAGQPKAGVRCRGPVATRQKAATLCRATSPQGGPQQGRSTPGGWTAFHPSQQGEPRLTHTRDASYKSLTGHAPQNK